MKVIWEETDIVPGVRYSRKDINEIWLIGYLADSNEIDRYVSISLNDGLITSPATKQQMAKNLTTGKYLPECLLKIS